MKILLCSAALVTAFAVRPDTNTSAPATAPSAATLPADHVWQVDGVHSSVVFKVKHASATWFYGSFQKVGGSITLDPDHVADGKIEVTIDADSIATRDEKRDQHLRGPDFFDAKQFPEIKFVSTKIAKEGDHLAVTGQLTLRGETKPLTVQVAKTGEGEFYGKRVGYETTFTIKRSDFGMDYGVADKVLGDEVTLMIAIESVQAAGK